METSFTWAERLARTLLERALPRRWAHVQGVAARARSLAPALGADAELLEAAAWLHDIGYLPDLARTGLHGLDGARYLRDTHHADPVLCRLVAHHSCAVIEAEERGLADLLRREFPPAPQRLADALTFCDMTTSPDGQQVHVTRRLAEIHDRYGSGPPGQPLHPPRHPAHPPGRRPRPRHQALTTASQPSPKITRDTGSRSGQPGNARSAAASTGPSDTPQHPPGAPTAPRSTRCSA